MRKGFWISVSIYAATALPPAAEPLHDEASGLRISSYRAPVPDTVPGGKTIDLATLIEQRNAGALLIDVMGSPGYSIRPDGTWITAAPHRTIPGAIWLPEIGHGVHLPEIGKYFTDALSSCQKSRAVVVFCRSDCWMSWNAVQHISGLNFTNILWFPGGVDEWADAALPVEDASPHTYPVCRSAS